jgi:hypothetical protein
MSPVDGRLQRTIRLHALPAMRTHSSVSQTRFAVGRAHALHRR